MTFVTSDTHFGDEKVLYKRGLNLDISEINKIIVENINKLVKKDDVIYFLGDIGINDKEYLKNIFKKINGIKILVRGNHDLLEDKDYYEIGFSEVHNSPIFYLNNIIMSHYPLPIDNDYFINLHGHLHGEVMKEKNYFNVNIDVNRYRPVRIDQYIKRRSNLKQVEKKFGSEWYFENTMKIKLAY